MICSCCPCMSWPSLSPSAYVCWKSHHLLTWPLQVLAFPVTLLIRFWQNHHLLDVMQRPVWRVVSGRSREYVKRILAGAKLTDSTEPLCIRMWSTLSGNLAGVGTRLLRSL